MRTAVVSDLHLGASSGRDLLRRAPALTALTAELRDADELVLLGDVVELREAPVAEVLAEAAPVLEEIDRALAGRRVTLVPGNHDYQLAGPLIERLRIERGALEPQTVDEPCAEGPLGAVAAAFTRSELRIAYPGVWIRDDVFATHGHYLDVHNTVPTFERLAIGAVQRLTAPVPEPRASADDYEAALSPVYALTYALAQSSAAGRRLVRSDRSVKTWSPLSRDGPRSLAVKAAAGIGMPAVVGALNAAGLGPLKPDLSGAELRRSALRGMSTVLDRLGVDAAHVIFGHTHRSGPHPSDAGWGPLLNPGSWIVEPAFLGADPKESPYWPGHCAIVTSSGPPQLRGLLDELPPSGT